MAITNNHPEGKYISSILLPGMSEAYEVHDKNAIHDVADLGLSAALVFKGTKDKQDELPTEGNKVGDVWLVKTGEAENGEVFNNKEFVWTETGTWEMLGNVHDAASSTHTHIGRATITGENTASAVTGSVTIPTITVGSEIKAGVVGGGEISTTKAEVLSGVTGTVTHTAVKNYVKATASDGSLTTTDTSVINNITPSAKSFYSKVDPTSTKVISSVSADKDKALTEVTPTSTPGFVTGFDTSNSIKPAYTELITQTYWSAQPTNATFNQVTDPGQLPKCNFIVDETGVLTITQTTGALPTIEKVKASDIVSSTSAQLVTGGTTTNFLTDLGTKQTASALTEIATSSNDFVNSVATGDVEVVETLDTATENALVSITPETTKVLDSASISKQPNIALELIENNEAGTASVVVGLENPVLTLNPSTTEVVTGVSITPTTVQTEIPTITTGSTTSAITNGVAAAQEWKQTSSSISTDGPIG